jgi:hypothetical protein
MPKERPIDPMMFGSSWVSHPGQEYNKPGVAAHAVSRYVYPAEPATNINQLAQTIKVETGVDLEEAKNKSDYITQVTTVLNDMMDNNLIPKSTRKDKRIIVNNALNKLTLKSIEHKEGPWYSTPYDIPIDEYFNYKNEQEASQDLLEGMFEDSEVYQEWIKFQENQ